MKANVGGIDRILRAIIGIALLAWLFVGAGDARWLGAIGAIPLLTGLLGFCPLCSVPRFQVAAAASPGLRPLCGL